MMRFELVALTAAFLFVNFTVDVVKASSVVDAPEREDLAVKT